MNSIRRISVTAWTILGLAAAGSSVLYAQAGAAGATAKCGDGTYSHAKTRQGACSNHDGIAEWYGDAGPSVPSETDKAAPRANRPARPRSEGAAATDRPAGATAKCKDGTYSRARNEQGACSSHEGIDEWYGASTTGKAAPSRSARPSSGAAGRSTINRSDRATGNENENPSGATARCNDGTYSHSQHREGTCSQHQGVKEWLKDVPK